MLVNSTKLIKQTKQLYFESVNMLWIIDIIIVVAILSIPSVALYQHVKINKQFHKETSKWRKDFLEMVRRHAKEIHEEGGDLDVYFASINEDFKQYLRITSF